MAKRKKVSLLVSAAGWLGSFVGALIPALKKRGMPDSIIHSMVSTDGKIYIDMFAEAVSQYFKDGYPITVNHEASIEDMLRAAQLIWDGNEKIRIEDYLSSKIFPVISKGIEHLKVQLIPAEEVDVDWQAGISSINEVVVALDKMGYRPITVRELIALSIAFPFAPMDNSIIAFGSINIIDTAEIVTEIYCYGEKRMIGSSCPEDAYNIDWQIGVVKK